MGCDRNLLTVRAVFNQSACPDELTVLQLQWTFGWPHTSVGPRGAPGTLAPKQLESREDRRDDRLSVNYPLESDDAYFRPAFVYFLFAPRD